MTKPYTRSQQKVLSAMAVITASVVEDARRFKTENGDDTPVTGCLTGIASIARSAKISEHRVWEALNASHDRSLVARGDVIRDVIVGMGGGTTLYKLNDELTAAALRRFKVEED